MASPGLTVLVVEDEELLRVMIERILQLSGHRAVLCASGEDALGLLEAGEVEFDVLLTDVKLPGISGHAVVQAVSRLRPTAGIVVMSAELEPDVRVRFILKPYERRELVSAVEGAWADAHEGED
jgi:two-component system cell cycle sensor histidine kinase/response regulator CckA